MSKMLFLKAASFFLATLQCGAQQATPPKPPQLSPGAAYQQAVRPVELTHRSIANWSEIEQASLAEAIKQASAACTTRSVKDFTGEALYDMARLCSLGLAWPQVVEATGTYITEPAQPKLHLAEAYAGEIDAELHLKNKAAAVKDAAAMLDAVPYGPIVAEATREVIDYTHLLFTDEAVALAVKRQPKILQALQTNAPTADSLSDLYRQGQSLAVLEGLAGSPADATAALTALDAALPDPLQPDDAIAIASYRRVYALLGQPLSKVSTLPIADFPDIHYVIPIQGTVTALLLFPDWCAQCVRLAQQIPGGVVTVEGSRAIVYGLLAVTVPPSHAPLPDTPTAARVEPPFKPAYAYDSLLHGQTLPVDRTWLDRFDRSDFPLLLLTDGQGIVRLIEVADEGALEPGATVDSAIALVARRWPYPARPAAPPATPASHPTAPR